MTRTMAADRTSAAVLTGAAWTLLVAFETLAQIALKAAGETLAAAPDLPHWFAAAAGSGWAWLGVLGYLGSFAAWMAILDKLPLSLGFPLTSVVYVTVTACSALVFREEIGALRWAGIGLIIVGVIVLGTEDEPACAR